uniref:Uncharacterized protein n=1 Tax=Anguilla anguilla TaxID=7936 RepID=A0A0E9R1R0_ANGAN
MIRPKCLVSTHSEGSVILQALFQFAAFSIVLSSLIPPLKIFFAPPSYAFHF